ncbi:MAG: CapA family protein [Epsilonproteobacteria bacterium]|nr:CapA family protein [Campylobacterota bacterium]
MKLSFFGDTVLDKPYHLDFNIDKFVFNLETPLSCEGTPARHKVNICQEGSHIVDTFKGLPLAVSLANNHVMDYGEEAFAKTKMLLEEQEIPYFGAGVEGDNFNNPVIIEFADKKIGLVGYSCPTTTPTFGDAEQSGSAYLSVENVLEDMEKLKGAVDLIIVQPHWGIQEIPFPTFKDRNIAHELIDAGADLIVGHHAHVIQSREIYKGKHIFYGIGNFIFPDLAVPRNHNGVEFTSMRYKTQEIEHRRSMVVTLDEDLNVDFFTVELNGDSVKENSFKLPTWLPDSEKSFQKKLTLEKRLIMLKNFTRNPKLPTLAHLKRFLKVKR